MYGEQFRIWTQLPCPHFSAFPLLRGMRLLDSLSESQIDTLNNVPALNLYFKLKLNQTDNPHTINRNIVHIHLDECRRHLYAKYLITIMAWKLTIRRNASCGLEQGPWRSILFQPLILQFLHHREMKGSQGRWLEKGRCLPTSMRLFQ